MLVSSVLPTGPPRRWGASSVQCNRAQKWPFPRAWALNANSSNSASRVKMPQMGRLRPCSANPGTGGSVHRLRLAIPPGHDAHLDYAPRLLLNGTGGSVEVFEPLLDDLDLYIQGIHLDVPRTDGSPQSIIP